MEQCCGVNHTLDRTSQGISGRLRKEEIARTSTMRVWQNAWTRARDVLVRLHGSSPEVRDHELTLGHKEAVVS